MKRIAIEGIVPALILQVPINCLCNVTNLQGTLRAIGTGVFQLLVALGDENI